MEYRNRLKIVFLIAVIALLAFSFLSYVKIQNFNKASDWVSHTQNVRLELNKTLLALQQIESSHRGYMLTKDSAFLPAVVTAKKDLTARLDTLAALIKDNPHQQQNVSELKVIVLDRLSFLHKILEDAETTTISTQRWLTGKALMDKVVMLVADMEEEEKKLLNQRLEFLNESALITPWFNVLLVIGALIIAVAAYFKIYALNESLNESSERYYRIVEEVQDYAILSLNRAGIVDNWNSGAQRIKGYTAEEIIGKSFYMFYTEEDRTNKLPDTLLKIASEKGKAVHEGWRVKKDGTLFWANVVITAIHNEKNELIGFSKVTHDLTEKKKNEDTIQKYTLRLENNNVALSNANKELARQREFSETILNTTPNLIAAFDAEMRVIAFNKACEDLWQVKREDVLGKKYEDAFPTSVNSKAYEDIKRAIKGETIHNAIYKSEVTGRYFENFMTPLIDSSGKVYAVVTMAHDTTDLVLSSEKIKQANDELNESNARFMKIFDNNPFPMTLTEMGSNRIKYANKLFCETFGLTPEEIIGHTSEELNLITPEENQRLVGIIFGLLQETRSLEELKNISGEEREEILLKLKQSETMRNLEVNYVRRNGETFPATVSYEVFRYGSEKYTIVSYLDITERKKTQQLLTAQNEALVKANKELESFNYISSHDLQEPLRQIQNFASRIVDMEEQNLSEKGKVYFEKMNNAAKRMQTLITDLLAYSRAQNAERQFEITDLNEIIGEVTSDLAEAIQDTQATIEANDMIVANIIPFQFLQMMHNLIGNALKFSRPDTAPHIVIKSKLVNSNDVTGVKLIPDTAYYHISVADNGIGFEPQYKDRIFEVFQRLHDRQKIAGTGIGLAIVKKIVENHNGIITATGELNKGATFDVYIPAVQRD